MNGFNPYHIERASSPRDLVPKDLDENCRWRTEMLNWVSTEGEDAQMMLKEWCTRDVMFFADALVWTLDPKRHPGNPLRPWITLPFQEEAFYAVEDALGQAGAAAGELDQAGHDLCLPKSRDMGVSYIAIICLDRRFLLYDFQVFVVVSSSEELVDKKSNPNSIFPKIDIIHSKLPPFMLGGVCRNKLQFSRPDVMSVIDGMATTGNVSRSGRPHAVFADEFAAWPVNAAYDFRASNLGATDCVLYVSTFKGYGNAFYEVSKNPDIPKVELHWTKHPWHSQGLYCSEGVAGPVDLRDKAFWETTRLDWLRKRYPLITKRIKLDNTTANPLLKDCYPFWKTGKVRSPYYDNFALRAPNAQVVGQELDMDVVASGSHYYDHALFEEYINTQCRVPFKRGGIRSCSITHEPLEFFEKEFGPLELWINLVLRGNALHPPKRNYQIGVDVGAGTRASDSAISVWDLVSREKVASYVRNDLRPERFAEVAFTFHKWFGGCQIIAEGQGFGQEFFTRLQELGCSNLFWMVNAKGVRAKNPGLYLEGNAKEAILTDLGRAILDGEAVCRDMASVKEALQFQLNKEGRAEHVATLSKLPGNSKKNHGDRWMADCLAWSRVKMYRSVDRHSILANKREESEAEQWMKSEEDYRYAKSRW